MPIGEAGRVTANSTGENNPITVQLTEPLANPVFAFTATSEGGDPFTLRLVDQTLDAEGNTTAFSFIIEEWEYLDGPHPATETINWLAVEEGVHQLPDGRIIEAGTTLTSSAGSAASLSGGFTAPPVVLTSVMSNHDETTVDSDPLNITATGFDLRLEEEEAEDGAHAAEVVGWIAIEQGGDASSGTAGTHGRVDEDPVSLALGAEFSNAVVLGETQTGRGRDPANLMIESQGNDRVEVFLEEEQSHDPETNHPNQTVGLVAFEDGLIPCFTRGTQITTLEGDTPVEDLMPGQVLPLWSGKHGVVRSVLRKTLSQADLRALPNLYPVRIRAGALGAGLPRRDLLVSPQHRLLVSCPVAQRMFDTPEVLLAAIRLTDLPGIDVDTGITSLTYVHVVMAQHEVIIAESCPSETLYTGAEAMRALTASAREELCTLFPRLRSPAHQPRAACPIPEGRLQKRMVARLLKNGKQPLDPRFLPRRTLLV